MTKEKEETTIKETEAKSEEKSPSFVAVIKQDDGTINFNIQGLTIDEALILMKKGNIKFDKLYDNAIRNE